MKCILFGGSGEVGGAVARELIKSDICSRLTLLVRRVITTMQYEAKVEQIVVDPSSVDFENKVKKEAQDHDVAISCVGVGSGGFSMGEEKVMEIEVKMVGKYARGCKAAGIEVFELLTAVGTKETRINSKFWGFRVMAKKFITVRDIGFKKLAVFKPGMIVGNAHTPRWISYLTSLIPDSLGWGNIRQDELAHAFVDHLLKKMPFQNQSVIFYGNKEMKLLIRE